MSLSFNYSAGKSHRNKDVFEPRVYTSLSMQRQWTSIGKVQVYRVQLKRFGRCSGKFGLNSNPDYLQVTVSKGGFCCGFLSLVGRRVICWGKLSVPLVFCYRYVPKYSDRQVWANSVDPDQTAPRGLIRIYTVCHFVSIFWTNYSNFRVITAIFHVSELLGFYGMLDAILGICVPFPSDVLGKMWDSIVSLLDHCLFI